jgi:hypothetical protein
MMVGDATIFADFQHWMLSNGGFFELLAALSANTYSQMRPARRLLAALNQDARAPCRLDFNSVFDKRRAWTTCIFITSAHR